MAAASWWSHTLGFGLLATLVSGAVLIATIFALPYAFLSDYPDDIRANAPAPTHGHRRAGLVGGLIFVTILFGSIIAFREER